MFNISTDELDVLAAADALKLLNSKLPISILLIVALVMGALFVLHLFDRNFSLFLASLKCGRGKFVIMIEAFVLASSLLFVMVKGISFMYWLYVLAVLVITLPFIITDYTYQYPSQIPNAVAMFGVYALTMIILTYHVYDMKANNIAYSDYAVSYSFTDFIVKIILASIAINFVYKVLGIMAKPHFYNAFKSNQLLSYGYAVNIWAISLCLAPEARNTVKLILIGTMVFFQLLAMVNFFAYKHTLKYVTHDCEIKVSRLYNPLTFGFKTTVINPTSLFFAVTPVCVNALIIVAMLYFGGII